MTKASRRVLLLLMILLLAAPVTSVLAAGSGPLITQYPVPGNPYHVAVEQPGRIWATLPAENAIIRLVVTSPGVYEISKKYQPPTAASEPYDIVYAAGAVWITEHAGNKIARFDPLTETWTEYPIPTLNSQPTGLVILPGDPVQVWFCEQAGNKLGRLRIPQTGASGFDEFPLPMAGAMMESVDAVSSEAVWFTAPGTHQIMRFQLSRWSELDPGRAFLPAYTGPSSRPFAIKLDAVSQPWITDPGGNRLGRFNPGTLTVLEWYPVPTADSELAGLDYALGYVWFTGKNSNRVGRLTTINFETQIRQVTLPAPGSAPTDIAVDTAGCAWIAASGVGQVVSWCPPYFRHTYLPGVYR